MRRRSRRTASDRRKDRVTERAQLYGKDGVRKISRSEQRRVKPRACALIAQINTAEDAADWLQQHKFVKKLRSCPQCQKKRLSFCVEAKDRGPHWRCLHCKTHVSFLTGSPFRGLKANPVMLLIRNYEQMRRPGRRSWCKRARQAGDRHGFNFPTFLPAKLKLYYKVYVHADACFGPYLRDVTRKQYEISTHVKLAGSRTAALTSSQDS